MLTCHYFSIVYQVAIHGDYFFEYLNGNFLLQHRIKQFNKLLQFSLAFVCALRDPEIFVNSVTKTPG